MTSTDILASLVRVRGDHSSETNLEILRIEAINRITDRSQNLIHFNWFFVCYVLSHMHRVSWSWLFLRIVRPEGN